MTTLIIIGVSVLILLITLITLLTKGTKDHIPVGGYQPDAGHVRDNLPITPKGGTGESGPRSDMNAIHHDMKMIGNDLKRVISMLE